MMDFDIVRIMDQVKEAANEQILAVLNEAKREMGNEGVSIQINVEENPSLTADNMYDLAGVSFPSEEIKEKFLGILNRKLQ